MSTSGKFLLEPAWLLHHYPYRDSSLLLEVFSREHGRLGLVARGARSSKSRWRGLLQGFRPLLLSWSQRGELGTLTGAENRPGIAPPGTRNLMSAWYLNELLMRLLTRPSINFMSIRYYVFTFTIVSAVLGIGLFLYRGEQGLNIDFVGGTKYTGLLAQMERIEEVRRQLGEENQKERLGIKEVKPLGDAFTFEITYADGEVQVVRLPNQSTKEEVQEAIDIMNSIGAIDHAKEVALNYANKAKELLEVLPDSKQKEILTGIVDYMIERDM